jgi:hypothetical protein
VVFVSKLPEEPRIRPLLKTPAGYRPEAWLPKPIAPHAKPAAVSFGNLEFAHILLRRRQFSRRALEK